MGARIIPAHAEGVPPLPAATEEKKKKKPSGFVSALKRVVLYLSLAAVAGGAYAAYRVWDARQPHEWSGTVEARPVAVGSRTGGRVKEVLVHEGDLVRPGQTIIVLEPGDLEAQLAIAKADVALAEAVSDKLKNGARPEEVAQARSRIAEARAAAESQRSLAVQQGAELARAKKLAATGTISNSETEQREAQARSFNATAMQQYARAEEAKAALKLLTGGSREEDIRAAAAAVAAAEGKVMAIQAQLDELKIRAPRSSRVETLIVRQGDILRPNAPGATLVEEGELYVRIYVPEPYLAKIKVGAKVPIFVDSYPKRPFEGVVEHINQVGEFTPRGLHNPDERADEVFGMKVTIKNGAEDLRAGMAAVAKIDK